MDILSDFYKRFGYENGACKTENIGASLCLFKSNMSEIGLRLSFGTIAAYRKRLDGRIIISRTDTNLNDSINISDIDLFHGSPYAEKIISIIKKLPPEGVGIEMLLHNETSGKTLSPMTLCAIKSYIGLLKSDVTPLSIISLTDNLPYHIASLTNSRIAVVNSQTKAFMTYNPEWEGSKVLVIKSGKLRKQQKLSQKYYEREYVRINAVSSSINSIGEFMYEASRDMLSYIVAPELEVLFKECCEFTKGVRILADLSGAVMLLETDKIDEAVMLIRSRYEKKTGLPPAFYISD